MIKVVRHHVHRVVHTYIIPHRKVILITKIALVSWVISWYLRNAWTQAPVIYAQQMNVFSWSSGNTGYQWIPIPTTGYQGIMIPYSQITHDRLTLSSQLDQGSISLLSWYGNPWLTAQLQIVDANDQIIFSSGIVVQSDASRSVVFPTVLNTPWQYHIQAWIQSWSQSLNIQRSGMISIISTYTQPSQQSVTTVSESSISESSISVPVVDIVSSEPASVTAQIPSPSWPSQGVTQAQEITQEITQEIVSEPTSINTLTIITESADANDSKWAPEIIAPVEPWEIQTPSQILSDEAWVTVPATTTDSSDIVVDTTTSSAKSQSPVESFDTTTISAPVPSEIVDTQSP